MFTQKISMDCTKEQYEKYLKDELLKMGYKEKDVDGSYWADNFVIVNNFVDLGNVTQISNANKHSNDRHYLGSFNAPLFLALAAMTDKAEGNYREYVIGVNSGCFYKMRKEDKILPEYTIIRKATKEEIMARFSDVKINEKIEYPLDVTCKTEAEMISLLKSKGYKILKPKTWEEI